MKKLIGFLFSILCIYVIYFDLTQGTLTDGSESRTATAPATQASTGIARTDSKTPAFQVKVAPGDTVLTIIEHQLNRQIPVSIDEIITDFSALNPGISPQKIQIGKVYRFPDYSNRK